MRWLIVSSRHHPSHGGIGTYVSSACAAAVSAGWNVHLLTRPSDLTPGSHVPENVTIHPLQTPDDDPAFSARLPALRRLHLVRPYRYGLWSLAVARALLDLDLKFDLVSFIDSQAEGFVALTSPAVRSHLAPARLLMLSHGTMCLIESLNHADAFAFGRSLYHRWENHALLAADVLAAPSQLLLDALPPHPHACVLPPPVLECPQPGPGDSRIVDDRQSVTFLGSFEPNKSPDVLIRALNIVFAELLRTRAVFIGADTPTGPDASSMRQHVLGLLEPRFRDRVHCLPHCPRPRTLAEISASSLVVVSSRFESFSYAAAEAVMLCRPAVITPACGIREYLPALPVVPHADHLALARTIMNLLADRALGSDIVSRARCSLRTRCSPEAFMASLTRLISAPPPPPRLPVDQPDSIRCMEQFLATVEQREQDLHPAFI